MRVRAVTTAEELAPLRARWDEVVAQSAAGPFLSFDWVTTWWQHFGAGRELLALLAEDEEGLAGVAPLNLARYRVAGFPVRVVEFIGAPLLGRRLATCLDFPVVRGREECLAGYAQALLKQADRWDLCAFHGVPATRRIDALGEAVGFRLAPTATYEVPCLDPQGQGWEQYLAGRDRSFRHWLRRTGRRAEEGGLDPVVRVEEGAGLAVLPELSRVCAASWKATRGLGLFLDGDPTARFLTDYLQRTQWDQVLLTTTAQEGRVVAYQFGFLHSGKLWFYDTAYDQAYDQAAPGFRVFSDMIQTGFRAGVTRIDLGPGLHPYKLRWTEARETRGNWLGFHRGGRSRLLASSFAAARALAASPPAEGEGMKGIARRLLLEALSRGAVTPEAALPALTYHSVDESGSAVSFPVASFRAQLEWLASQGFHSLTATQAAEALASGQVPPKRVALTFDDGFASVRETAFPILAEYGFVATVFCSTGYLGRPCGWERAADIPAFDLMSWEAVRFLASQGWEIGAHTITHARLPRVAEDVRREEIRESRRILEEQLGRAVTSFAYPYGACDDACAQAVREAGLRSAWTMEPVINAPGRDPFLLGRFNCNRVQSDSPRTAALAAQVCLGQRYGAYAFLTGRAVRQRLRGRR